MLTAYFAFFKSAKRRSSTFFLILLAIQISLGISAFAEPFKIHVVQRGNNGNTYKIGDRITLYVEIPQEIQNQNSSYEIKPEISSKELSKAGWYLDKQVNFITGNLRFVVSPIQLGDLLLPQLVISNQNKEELGRTEVWQIKVVGEPSTADQSKPPEYLAPIQVALSRKMWLMIAIVSTFLIFGSAFAYRKYKQFKNKNVLPEIKPIIPQEPDHLIALGNLQKLYQKYPFKVDHLKPVAFGVSEILKIYFSSRHNVDAREATTQEMLEQLRVAGISSTELQEIKSLFTDLDLIKFTKLENYKHFTEPSYREFRTRAEGFIKRWAQSLPEAKP